MKIIWESGESRQMELGCIVRGLMLDGKRPIAIQLHPLELEKVIDRDINLREPFGTYYTQLHQALDPSATKAIEIHPYHEYYKKVQDA